jgi:hypothetical protein
VGARDEGKLMKHFDTSDVVSIEQFGVKMLKRPNPVFMQKQDEPFQIQTNEGLTTAKAGDWVAYDPISGHVWPVADSYVQQHYDMV